MILKIGDKAPDFTAPLSNGESITLSRLKGKNIVLYFYPKDDTPGCTIEAKEFTEHTSQFSSKDTLVLGVSYDNVECHKAFIEKYHLGIQLISDTDGSIAKLYESVGNGYAQRNTFVINKEGEIVQIFINVKPQGHAIEILRALS
jgi:peroxiredoxin Q/BCP